MRKYLPLALLAVSSFFVYSCDDRSNDVVQTQDSDTVAGVTDVYGLTKQDDYTYYIRKQITGMHDTDMVLVYKKTATSPTVWELLPLSYYVTDNPNDDRQYQYRFDFATNDIQIYAEGNYVLSTTPSVVDNNNVFRILVIPANGFKTTNAAAVDYKDYNSVIKYYNINDSNPKTLK